MMGNKFLDFLEEDTCPECGHYGIPEHLGTYNEFTDRDGNRGMRVTYYRCPECGYENGSKC